MAHTVTQIVEAANKRTERRAETKLDLRLEFWFMLAEFCRENHFWWREKHATFNTAVGTKEYDLTADAGANADDFDELRYAWRIDSATEKTELLQLHSSIDQAAAIEATTNDTVSSCFIKPGSPQTLHLGAPANAVKKVRIAYWAVPQPAVDTTDEVIPLVPGSLHWALATAMEAHILVQLFGENDPRAVVALARRERAVQKAAKLRSWSSQRVFEMRASEDAVRATG